MTGWAHRRRMHACFAVPSPPNLGLSRQAEHLPPACVGRGRMWSGSHVSHGQLCDGRWPWGQVRLGAHNLSPSSRRIAHSEISACRPLRYRLPLDRRRCVAIRSSPRSDCTSKGATRLPPPCQHKFGLSYEGVERPAWRQRGAQIGSSPGRTPLIVHCDLECTAGIHQVYNGLAPYDLLTGPICVQPSALRWAQPHLDQATAYRWPPHHTLRIFTGSLATQQGIPQVGEASDASNANRKCISGRMYVHIAHLRPCSSCCRPWTPQDLPPVHDALLALEAGKFGCRPHCRRFLRLTQRLGKFGRSPGFAAAAGLPSPAPGRGAGPHDVAAIARHLRRLHPRKKAHPPSPSARPIGRVTKRQVSVVHVYSCTGRFS